MDSWKEKGTMQTLKEILVPWCTLQDFSTAILLSNISLEAKCFQHRWEAYSCIICSFVDIFLTDVLSSRLLWIEFTANECLIVSELELWKRVKVVCLKRSIWFLKCWFLPDLSHKWDILSLGSIVRGTIELFKTGWKACDLEAHSDRMPF